MKSNVSWGKNRGSRGRGRGRGRGSRQSWDHFDPFNLEEFPRGGHGRRGRGRGGNQNNYHHQSPYNF